MGTAGILCKFAGKFNYPVFITNSDIVINSDLNKIPRISQKEKKMILLWAFPKNMKFRMVFVMLII